MWAGGDAHLPGRGCEDRAGNFPEVIWADGEAVRNVLRVVGTAMSQGQSRVPPSLSDHE